MHYEDDAGMIGTRVHMFCRQMQEIGSHFGRVILVCPIIKQSKSDEEFSYYPSRFDFIGLPQTGGKTLSEKVKLIRTIPVWLKAFRQVKTQADIYLLRFPNNLNIVGLYSFRKKKKFAIYTGTWLQYATEPFTFKLQKMLLRHYFNGPVFIYNRTPEKHAKFNLSFSPSFSVKEWNMAEKVVLARKLRWQNQHHIPVFVSVGSLLTHKNYELVLRVFKMLKDRKFHYTLTIAGEGLLRDKLESYILENDLTAFVNLPGHVSINELKNLYSNADFVIQLPLAEGFGKVPIEGFFYGLIPFLSDTAMSGVFVGGQQERGFLIKTDNASYIADIIMNAWTDRNLLTDKMTAGRNYAKEFTVDLWASSVINVLKKWYE